MEFTLFNSLAILFIIIFIGKLISVYNDCKTLEIQVNELAADIESTKIKLNRVAAEISSLLHKYSIHESDIFKAIVSGSSNIRVLGIKYPQLKADSIFLNASSSWDGLYSELQTSVVRYNQKITEYNIAVTNFPNIIFCYMLTFRSKIHAKIT